MKYPVLLIGLPFLFSCKKKLGGASAIPVTLTNGVAKPSGVFSSAGATSVTVLNNTTSFSAGEYSKVFEQAKLISARYIEPWDYEFTITTWNNTFTDFNAYADTLKKY
jgi:hypothetical protein